MDDERDDLLEYREVVVAEIERRLAVVKELEEEKSSKEYTLGTVKETTRVVSGSAIEVMGRAAYRAKLQRQLAELTSKLNVANADLQRANERLREVDAELAAMEIDGEDREESALDEQEPEVEDGGGQKG